MAKYSLQTKEPLITLGVILVAGFFLVSGIGLIWALEIAVYSYLPWYAHIMVLLNPLGFGAVAALVAGCYCVSEAFEKDAKI